MTRESSRSVDNESPSHSRSVSNHSDLSAESFMMKANRANFNSDQRPSQKDLLLRNNSAESFMTDTMNDQENPEAFTHLKESPAASNVFKQNIPSEGNARGSMEFDHPNEPAKSVSPLAVIGDAGDMALQEIKENSVIGALSNTPKGRQRRKSDAQRTSYVKVGFLNLKEQRQWDKIMQHLNKV